MTITGPSSVLALFAPAASTAAGNGPVGAVVDTNKAGAFSTSFLGVLDQATGQAGAKSAASLEELAAQIKALHAENLTPADASLAPMINVATVQPILPALKGMPTELLSAESALSPSGTVAAASLLDPTLKLASQQSIATNVALTDTPSALLSTTTDDPLVTQASQPNDQRSASLKQSPLNSVGNAQVTQTFADFEKQAVQLSLQTSQQSAEQVTAKATPSAQNNAVIMTQNMANAEQQALVADAQRDKLTNLKTDNRRPSHQSSATFLVSKIDQGNIAIQNTETTASAESLMQPTAGTHDKPLLPHTEGSKQSLVSSPAVQVQTQFVREFGEGKNKVTVQLHPKELGKVEVSVEYNTVDNVKHARVSIVAENADALAQLQRDSKDFIKGLQQSGLQIDRNNLDFSLSSDQRGPKFAFDQQEGSKQFNMQQRTNEENTRAQAAESLTPLYQANQYRSGFSSLRVNMTV